MSIISKYNWGKNKQGRERGKKKETVYFPASYLRMCGSLSRWYIRLYLIRVTICLVLHCMHYSLPNKSLIGRLGLLAVFLLS